MNGTGGIKRKRSRRGPASKDENGEGTVKQIAIAATSRREAPTAATVMGLEEEGATVQKVTEDDRQDVLAMEADELRKMGKGRYWGVEQTCNKCQETGHIQKDCPYLICQKCRGEHKTRDCHTLTRCFTCNQLGHTSSDCPISNRRSERCSRCDSRQHPSQRCPDIWRCYIPDRGNKNWPKKIPVYCYSCAEEGHYGDDCPDLRNQRWKERSAFCGASLPREYR